MQTDFNFNFLSMASDSTTDTGARTKVTLTNWERLNNSPLLLPQASAVQWNEYVFVLAKDGTALLYHTKYGMWSMLPCCELKLPDGPPPLTLCNGKLVTISNDGSAYFDPCRGEWRVARSCNMLGCRSATKHKVVTISFKNSLLAVVGWTEETRKYRNETEVTKYCKVLQQSTSSVWETICKLGKKSLESAAVVGTDLFVLAGGTVYKITLPETEGEYSLPETEEDDTDDEYPLPAKVKRVDMITKTLLPKTTIAKLPFQGSTLHTIKDTLFAFGGRDKDDQPTSDVLRYNPDTDSWENAGYMRSARYNVAVTTVQQNDDLDVIVLGGSLGSSQFEMKPRMNTRSGPTQNTIPWENPTSIVERCMVE